MITGSCHCGRNRFEIDGALPEKLTRCTCSFCAKRGALVAYFTPQQFRMMTPEDSLGTYRWNTKLVAHRFCVHCGCSTHSDSPAFEPNGNWDGNTRRIGVNARLFDHYDANAAQIAVIDGKNLW